MLNNPYEGLKSFQRQSAAHAFHRLFVAPDSSRRFLVADETGLGKTHIAAGIIAATIQKLNNDPTVRRIDIVYVCSNSDIADQNISKLIRDPQFKARKSTRLTMLITERELLKSVTRSKNKAVTLVSFTPGTSFELRTGGSARERAVIYLLISEILKLNRDERYSLRRVLKTNVNREDRFLHGYIEPLKAELTSDDGTLNWEPNIRKSFEIAFRDSEMEKVLRRQFKRVEGREVLGELRAECRGIVGELRRMLARASVEALEPDLVILDEFQRFKDLLKQPDPDEPDVAVELANLLFEQEQSRTLLLSATPYKIFTLQQERSDGDDHYEDLYSTLGFLYRSDTATASVRNLFAQFRSRLLSGEDATSEREDLRTQLLKVMCRTERRRDAIDSGGLSDESLTAVSTPSADELAGYAQLRRLADELDTTTSLEHWKASPYFANFFDRYQLGEEVKEALKRSPSSRQKLAPRLAQLHQILPETVANKQSIALNHPRLRHLASEVLDSDWWKMLWVPPSYSRWRLDDPFLTASLTGMTKRLIFSSWVAAPSAISSLLSYEADRRARAAACESPTAEIRPRLNYRMTPDGKPAALSTLALFWPNPQLVKAAKKAIASLDQLNPTIAEVIEMVAVDLRRGLHVRSSGVTDGHSDEAIWRFALKHQLDSSTRELLHRKRRKEILESLSGQSDEVDPQDAEGRTRENLGEHVDVFLSDLKVEKSATTALPGTAEALARFALGSPANVAYWVLEDLAGKRSGVTPFGLWSAAAVVGSAFRSLFNRPEPIVVLDAFKESRQLEQPYWRTVLDYSIAGGLLSVMEEHAYVLLGAKAGVIRGDDDLMDLAKEIHKSIVWRTAPVLAFSPTNPNERIRFNNRFALRYGNLDQDADDLRLPQVRAAFNSPFWPFVLASTSVGQEGVDFHWWCHALVHWNLPSNPVDYEQREGRIDRFRGHAIRKNIAEHFHGLKIDTKTNAWEQFFRAADQLPKGEHGDLFPSWEFPGSAKIERSVYALPLSREIDRWRKLQQLIALYRLAFGQPRQEDFVQLLSKRNINIAYAEAQQISLAPPEVQA